MVRIAKQDDGPDDSDGGWVYSDDANDVEQDPVRSMHDTQEGSGDEVEVNDIYDVDAVEAQQMRVALDPAGDEEAQLY